VKTGERRARAVLLADGVEIGEADIASTSRFMLAWQGLTLGVDSLAPVSWDYPPRFPFSGEIDHVDVQLHDDGPHDVHEVID
jgi:hypothetical protein